MRKATLKYKNLFSLTSKILGSYNLCGFLPYKPILAINRDPKFWTCRISITKNKKENRKHLTIAKTHSLRDFKLVMYSKTKHFWKNMWPSSWMVCLTGLLNDTNSLHDQSFKQLLFGFSKHNVTMANTGNWIYVYGLLPQPLCLFSFKYCMGFQGNTMFQVF